MRRKPIVRLLLLLLTIPWLAGCWNKVEIEEGAYVLAIGIDKGRHMPYNITVAIAKPQPLAGKEGGGKEEKPVILSSVEAPSLTSALSMLNGYIGRNVTLHHAKALFLHEEFARNDGLNLLDELLRFRETRQTLFFIVTREKARDFLNEMKPALDKNPMRFIEQMTYHYRRTAMLPAMGQINAFASRLDVAYAQPLAYYAAVVDEEEKEGTETRSEQAEADVLAGEIPREGGSNVEMIGAAAFRRQRMVGVLTGDEIRHVLMLQDKFRQAMVTFKDPADPNRYVSVQLSRSRPLRLQADLSGSRPRFSGLISLEAQILGIQTGSDYTEPELHGVLERSMGKQIEEQIQSLVVKTQEWETDIVGFGRHLVSRFPTVAAWESYNWPSRFPDAEVDIKVQVRLRRFGLTLSPVEPTD